MGVWKGHNTAKMNNLGQHLFPDIVNLYRNFQGRQLLVSTVDNWPFYGLKYLKNGTVATDRGIDVNIMKVLGHYLNFT